ncbi:centromere/kinetochore protein zw10 homolog isoform X3 [Varanus komodoensis]|uniref:centromere/kinetochore protein zw10 homolog isoform X3 n=1 Tax=Varanus komodoensis TaxID=61221 RepID=UPI001CF7E625|nr:centromere/kinetochore protein zw10 homolog isoform X3 [Varanus komodoensis]
MEVAEAEAVPLPPPAAKGLSLVEDVLACSGRLEREGLGHRISRLSCRVEELKGEVCSMISQRYVEFLPSMQNAKELESQVEELSGNIDQLKSRIENEVQQDLNVAIAEFAELKQQLERDTLVLCVLKQLQEFDAALKQVNALLPQKKYVPAACHLNQARRALKTMESRRGFELKILKALSREVTLQTQNVLYLLGQEWQQMAVWKLPQAQETGSLEAAVGTELHLRTVLPEAELVAGVAVASVLQAFAILGELRLRFKHFSQSLLKHILRPLVCHASLRPLLEEQPNVVILRLETAGSDRGHAPPVEVFAKVKLVFEALHKYHLGVSLEPCIEEGSNSVPALAEVLGDLIWKELSDCLIHDCLVHSIPNSSSKLGQYIEVIKATEEFEKALKDMQFLKEESTDLLTYARNVNCHFANKKCQDVIVAARMLMTSEIHNTVKVSPDSSVILPKLPDPGAGDQRLRPEIDGIGVSDAAGGLRQHGSVLHPALLRSAQHVPALLRRGADIPQGEPADASPAGRRAPQQLHVCRAPPPDPGPPLPGPAGGRDGHLRRPGACLQEACDRVLPGPDARPEGGAAGETLGCQEPLQHGRRGQLLRSQQSRPAGPAPAEAAWQGLAGRAPGERLLQGHGDAAQHSRR